MKVKMIFILTCFVIYLYRCIPPEKITLHGHIAGLVTDAVSGEPIQGAFVILLPVNNTTVTNGDGRYEFRSIPPDAYDYEIKVSAFGYDTDGSQVDVSSANVRIYNFALKPIPVPSISDSLEFGFELDTVSFKLSNIGKADLNFSIQSSKLWITVDPNDGIVSAASDTVIVVSVNRTGLSNSTHYEYLEIYYKRDVVVLNLFINRVMDMDSNFYKVVEIGSQIWMAENLNVGVRFDLLDPTNIPTNNQIIEKVCYDNSNYNCKIYGGLYYWDEMMDYNPSDAGKIGKTQGICPEGWHIPTKQEWETLINHLGGLDSAAIRLTEGTMNCPNPDPAHKNESGFTALFGGQPDPPNFIYLDSIGRCWSSTSLGPGPYGAAYIMQIGCVRADVPTDLYMAITTWLRIWCGSVRCIKDPLP